MITPGVYTDMPEAEYHGHRDSLSHSGAKTILPPGCPALFKHQRDHGRPDKRVFDFGQAAHKLVLGAGSDLYAVDADNWMTKAAKAQRDEIRAKGGVPLLAHEMAQVEEMAEAIRSHPLASLLFAKGQPEVSLFWLDERSGVTLRARLDWLPEPRDGRMILADLKTAESADPGTFARQAARFDYCGQAAWYLDAVHALDLAADAAFLFVVIEKQPPYLVSVIELDSTALRIGRNRNRRAIDTFADCVARDEWPGYTADDVALVSLPRWAEMENAS